MEKARVRLQPKWVQVSACTTRDRNNRNHRVAPAALQIRATLNEDPRLFELPHKRVPEMNNADNIQLLYSIQPGICRDKANMFSM